MRNESFAAVSGRSMSVLFVLLGCLAACGGAAPKPVVPKKLGLCEMPLPRRAGSVRPMRPDDWVRLMLVGEQRGQNVVSQTLCTGERIEHVPLPVDCEVQTFNPGVPSPVPLTEASVIERILPGDKRLVWIMTHRFQNGDGYGPVASVASDKHKVYIEAFGLLRMRPQRVDLNLWNIGKKTVLMAAGETCGDLRQAKTCRRAGNVLVLDRDRFHSAPIRRTGSQECIDAPWVEFKREADLTLDNGWNRHMRIIATLNFDQRYVVITEQVDVNDTDPNHPDVPPRDVRRIDTERFIHVDGPNLFTRQPPLWPRIIPTEGRTDILRDMQ